ncbi:hypothetical protein E3J62_05565 [candidate division TA06 bacterium]|uniref:Peptidase S8/S53 domain-containing protein n=1 Tax=candidate division TA06 bacterium TaxID=2250710 RepID=A0A523UU11_UNCT6|nr:MAG: hypothetical protein E3J62_05565 [candidate division TA06 bacterium]
MSKSKLLVVFFVSIVLLSIGTVWGVSRAGHMGKIDPVLKEKLARMGPNSTVLVWVMFKDKGEGGASLSRATELAERYLSPDTYRRRRAALKRGRVVLYDDLPLYEDYIRGIEDRGGRLRAMSRWLNAASFVIPAGQVEKASNLEYVKDIREVALFKSREYRKTVSRNALGDGKKRNVKLVDYGPSYEQLNIINVTKVHDELGFFGEGANIGILDTGFRTSIKAIEHVNVQAEHDFLGGDQIPFYRSSGLGSWGSVGTVSQRVKLLENLAMTVDASDTIHAFWEGDTIRFTDASARDIWYSRSSDGGVTWGTVGNISASAGLSRRPSVVASDTVYLFWEDGLDTLLNLDGDQDIFMVKWFNNSVIDRRNISNDLTWSTWPSAFIVPGFPDRIDLAWVDNDSTIMYANSSNWSNTSNVSGTTGRVSPASIGVDDSGYIHIVWSTEPDGELIHARSTDGGSNFSSNTVPSSGSEDPVLVVSDSILHLFFSDFPSAAVGQVVYMRSTDHGANWTGTSVISGDLSPFLGRVSASASGSRVVCAWENNRVIYVRRSTDDGQTWGVTDSVDLSFSYDPVVYSSGPWDYLTFKRRGDDNTDWEPGQDGDRQHWHGTEMLSIMGGFKPTQLFGPAFRANFFLAKTEKYVNIKGYPHFYEKPCEEDTWIEGLEWLEAQGVDIVSSSLGYPDLYEYYKRDGKTALVSQAAYKAYKLGVLVVSAIGNAAKDDTLEAGSLYPPSDADSIVSVGGVLPDRRWLGPYEEGYSFYSSKGPSADGRRKPEVVAPIEVYMVNPAYSDSFWYGVGTSGATALVAGVAGLLIEAHPSWRGSPEKLRDCLMNTATMHSSPNDTMGWGIVDAYKAINCEAIEETEPFRPDSLGRTFPNPVRGDRGYVTITFHIRNQSIPRIRVYTMSGELVRKWEKEDLEGLLNVSFPILPGRYKIDWNLKNEAGNEVASGIYLVTLQGFATTSARKLAIVR